MACLYTFTNWPIYIFVVLGSSCIFALNPKQSTESREENGEELRSSQGTAIAASSAQRFFIVTTFLPILSKPWLLQSTPHHLRHPQQLLPPPNPSPIPSITSQTLTFSNSGLSPRPQVPLILLSFRLRMNLAAQSAKLKLIFFSWVFSGFRNFFCFEKTCHIFIQIVRFIYKISYRWSCASTFLFHCSVAGSYLQSLES
nr:uncharacterized protein LOC103411662 [Malus domestica]